VAVLELAEWVLARRWWILGITAATAAITIWVVRRLMRWAAHRDAARGALLYAGRLTQVSGARRAAVTGGVTINFINAAPAQQAEVIRQAIAGTAEGATTEKE
jgi:hypothetical protein